MLKLVTRERNGHFSSVFVVYTYVTYCIQHTVQVLIIVCPQSAVSQSLCVNNDFVATLDCVHVNRHVNTTLCTHYVYSLNIKSQSLCCSAFCKLDVAICGEAFVSYSIYVCVTTTAMSTIDSQLLQCSRSTSERYKTKTNWHIQQQTLAKRA
jgi:hypothetical protein